MSVRHALLALLSEGPKYGLQLREEFEANTGQVWPLNVGQVYTTLQRLERDGLVMKVLIAVRVPGTDVSEIIQAHRRYLIELMQEWTRLKEDDNGRDIAFSLVVDSELFRLDSVVRWLDAAEARLRRALANGWSPARTVAPLKGAAGL